MKAGTLMIGRVTTVPQTIITTASYLKEGQVEPGRRQGAIEPAGRGESERLSQHVLAAAISLVLEPTSLMTESMCRRQPNATCRQATL